MGLSAAGGFLPPVIAEILAKTDEFTAGMLEARGEMTATAEHGSSSFSKLASVGQAAFIAIGTAAVGLGVESVHLADEFEASHARLEVAVKNSGSSFDVWKSQIDETDKTLEHLGFTNTDTQSSLATLTNATHDEGEALGLMGLAADIARGRHIDLAAATGILVKVETNHVSALGRLGINTKDATGATISQEEAIRRLTSLYGGNAQAYTETFAGKMKTLEATVTDLGTQLGLWLIPKLEAVATVGADTVEWFNRNRVAADALALAVGGPLVVAMGAFVALKIDAALGGIAHAWDLVTGASKAAAGAQAAVTAADSAGAVAATAETAATGALAAADATLVSADAAVTTAEAAKAAAEAAASVNGALDGAAAGAAALGAAGTSAADALAQIGTNANTAATGADAVATALNTTKASAAASGAAMVAGAETSSAAITSVAATAETSTAATLEQLSMLAAGTETIVADAAASAQAQLALFAAEVGTLTAAETAAAAAAEADTIATLTMTAADTAAAAAAAADAAAITAQAAAEAAFAANGVLDGIVGLAEAATGAAGGLAALGSAMAALAVPAAIVAAPLALIGYTLFDTWNQSRKAKEAVSDFLTTVNQGAKAAADPIQYLAEQQRHLGDQIAATQRNIKANTLTADDLGPMGLNEQQQHEAQARLADLHRNLGVEKTEWKDLADERKKLDDKTTAAHDKAEAEQSAASLKAAAKEKALVSDKLTWLGSQYGAYNEALLAAQHLSSDALTTIEKNVLAAVTATDGAIGSFDDLVTKFGDSEKVTTAQVDKFLSGSVAGAQTWAKNMKTLAQDGLDQGLIEELYQAGPKSEALVKALLQKVQDGGINAVNAAVAAGRQVEIDARKTLSDIMLEGEQNWINAQKFFAGHPIVGNIVLNVSGQGETLFNPKTGQVTSPGGKVIGGWATGGDVNAGAVGWVGEKGPELVQFSSSAHVYPHGQVPPSTAAMVSGTPSGSGGGDTTYVFDLRGSVGVDEAKLGRFLEDVLHRHGDRKGGLALKIAGIN